MNTDSRKQLYKRFRAMLFNCGAWVDQRHNQKKSQAIQGDYIWHQGKIMPECAVVKCRKWYPNQEKHRYMGHKWN